MMPLMKLLLGQRRLSCGKGGVAGLWGRRLVCAEAGELREEDDDTCDVIFRKKALLRSEAFTEAQIEAVLDGNTRSDRLSLLLTILKEHGISGQAAGLVITSVKCLRSSLRIVRFYERVQALEEAGFSPALLRASMLKPSAFFFASFSTENVNVCIAFLRELGLSTDEACLTLLRRPQLVRMPFDRQLKHRWELLREIGFSQRGILCMIRHHTPFFWVAEASLRQKLAFIEELKMDLNASNGMRALGLWIRFPVFRLQAKLDCLISFGFSLEDASAMVRLQPGLLCLSLDYIVQKFDFLLHTMKVSINDIMKNSSSVICSLENRLIPRFAITEDLKAKGILAGSISLSSLFSAKDERFVTAFKVDGNLLSFYAAQSRLFTLKASSC